MHFSQKIFIFFFTILSCNILITHANTCDLPDSLVKCLQENKKANINRIEALSKVVDYYFDKRQYQKATSFVNEILELSDKINNNYIKALSYYYIGTIYLDKKEYQKSANYLISAKNIISILRDNYKNKKLNIRICISLGACYFKCYLFSESYECIQLGIQLNKDIGDPQLNNKLIGNLSTIYGAQKKYRDEINIDKKTVQNTLISQHDKFIPYLNIGTVYLYIGKPDSAIIFFNKAFCCTSSTKEISKLLLYKGIAYNKKNDYNTAITYFKYCLDTLSIDEDFEIRALLLIDFAYSYYMTNQYTKSLSLINQGIKESQKHDFIEIELNGLSKKSRILYDMGQYKESAQCMFKYDSLLYKYYQKKDITRLESSILKQKIKEIEEKNKKNKYIIEKKQNQQFYIFFCILLFLISIIIIGALLINRKNILLKNKNIKEQFLSNELDTKNRELTSKILLQTQKNKTLNNTIKKLNNISEKKIINKKDISAIIHNLSDSTNDKTQKDFDYYFVKIHPNFYNKLLSDFPHLTQAELHLCAFLKINLSTKEIANINNISPNSVRIARVRLRKHLNLTNSNATLINFLSKY